MLHTAGYMIKSSKWPRPRGQKLQPRPWPHCIWPWPPRCCCFGLNCVAS